MTEQLSSRILLFHTIVVIFLFGRIHASSSANCTADDNDVVNTQRELYDIVKELLQKHQDVQKGLEYRVSTLETKLTVYEDERRQLYRYAEVITDTLKRVVKTETKTDTIQEALRVLQNDYHEISNITTEQIQRTDAVFKDLGLFKLTLLEVSHNISQRYRVNDSIYAHTQNRNSSHALKKLESNIVEDSLHIKHEANGGLDTNFTSDIENCEQLINNKLDTVEKEVSHIIKFVNNTDTSITRLQGKLVALTDRFRNSISRGLNTDAKESTITTEIQSETSISAMPSPSRTLQSVVSTAATSTLPSKLGHRGYDFWLTFPKNYRPAIFPDRRLHIFITTRNNSEVSVQIHKNDGSTSYVLNKSLTVDIENSMQLSPNVIERKGIRVTSNYTISVSGYSTHGRDLSDVFNVIPASDLGTSYIGLSYHIPSGDRSFISILAISDDTSITVTLNMTVTYSYNGVDYTRGDSFDVYLKQFHTFQITHTSDLTGTKLTSSKPIAVQSGCTRAHPTGNDGNYYSVYLPPISSLGSAFVMPNFLSATKTFIRVVPVESSTLVQSQDTFRTHQLMKASDIVTSTSHPSIISCSRHCLIAAFSIHSKPECHFMTLMPALSQFSKDYHFVTPHDTFGNYTHYITITVKYSEGHTLMINNRSISSFTMTSSTVNAGQESWTVLSMKLGRGTYSISSTLRDSYFGVIAYGLRAGAAYAYPLGMKLN